LFEFIGNVGIGTDERHSCLHALLGAVG
jgi:hypothetical protein